MKLLLICMMTFMVDGIMTYPSDSSEKPPREIPPTKLQIIRPLSPLASPSQRRMVGIRPQPPPPPPLPLPLQGHLRVKGPPRYYDDFEEPRDYHFNYLLNDDYTGNYQTREETKDGDRVVGSYSLREPTGAIRKVRYIADKFGFRAIVQREWPGGHRL